jgi:hypothetical protein
MRGALRGLCVILKLEFNSWAPETRARELRTRGCIVLTQDSQESQWSASDALIKPSDFVHKPAVTLPDIRVPFTSVSFLPGQVRPKVVWRGTWDGLGA